MASAALPPLQSSGSDGDLQLLRELGRGAFGTVHYARTAAGEERAVKRIRVSSLTSDKHKQNLHREINIMSNIHHVNIVRLFSCKKHGNEEYWLVLEYCGGGDLSHFIRAQQNPHRRLLEPVALGFFRQIVAALEFMDGQKMIHRDLKPANILLTGPGVGARATLKIADFGFARLLPGQQLA